MHIIAEARDLLIYSSRLILILFFLFILLVKSLFLQNQICPGVAVLVSNQRAKRSHSEGDPFVPRLTPASRLDRLTLIALAYEFQQLPLYNSGDHSAAIPHLQQATRNPHIRTKVLLLLGRTFKAKGMFDLSIKQLSDALADLHAMDNTKKEVLYEKGVIHGETGDKAAALDCFKQIYEVDYGYRDVAQRVESSYGG